MRSKATAWKGGDGRLKLWIRRALRLASPLIAFLFLALFIPTPGASGQVNLTVLLKDSLIFEPRLIVAQPGDNVSLKLVNDGVLRHTFTLFSQPNAQVPLNDNAALQEFASQAELIVDIVLAGGEEAWANFTAPPTEASYILVCTEPGHAVGGMHGVLAVGIPPPDGPSIRIGIVQGLMLGAIAGTVVFAVLYHLRTTRRQ